MAAARSGKGSLESLVEKGPSFQGETKLIKKKVSC